MLYCHYCIQWNYNVQKEDEKWDYHIGPTCSDYNNACSLCWSCCIPESLKLGDVFLKIVYFVHKGKSWQPQRGQPKAKSSSGTCSAGGSPNQEEDVDNITSITDTIKDSSSSNLKCHPRYTAIWSRWQQQNIRKHARSHTPQDTPHYPTDTHIRDAKHYMAPRTKWFLQKSTAAGGWCGIIVTRCFTHLKDY